MNGVVQWAESSSHKVHCVLFKTLFQMKSTPLWRQRDMSTDKELKMFTRPSNIPDPHAIRYTEPVLVLDNTDHVCLCLDR